MTRFFRLAALAIFLTPLAASAQPTDRSDRVDRRIERMTERFSLTDAQQQIVRDALTAERTPGASWALAADLAPTLTDAQLEQLRTPPSERRRARGEASGERAERRAERRQTMENARVEALGLTDSQIQALEAARAERRAQVLPPEVADVLTDEQEAVLLVHRAITRGARGARGPRMRGARRGGPRGGALRGGGRG
ncbi:MAG: hypothetical protein AAFQ43_05715 [Bacteroidota bacterium]